MYVLHNKDQEQVVRIREKDGIFIDIEIDSWPVFRDQIDKLILGLNEV